MAKTREITLYRRSVEYSSLSGGYTAGIGSVGNSAGYTYVAGMSPQRDIYSVVSKETVFVNAKIDVYFYSTYGTGTVNIGILSQNLLAKSYAEQYSAIKAAKVIKTATGSGNVSITVTEKADVLNLVNNGVSFAPAGGANWHTNPSVIVSLTYSDPLEAADIAVTSHKNYSVTYIYVIYICYIHHKLIHTNSAYNGGIFAIYDYSAFI